MKLMICGRKRAGKDTACDWLRAHYGGNKDFFAKPLYDALYAALDVLDMEHEKIRPILESLGKHRRRDYPDYFIHALFERLNLTPAYSNRFISDGRFQNEIDSAKDYGYKVVLVLADDDIRRTRLDAGDIISNDAVSENGFDYSDHSQFDAVLTNNGTLEDYYIQVQKM